MNILLVQLGSNGDCLFVTTIAKQIKEIDYPGCNLTWMIGSLYSTVIENNIFVDDKIIINIDNLQDLINKREKISEFILEAKKNKYFDKVFITDFYQLNLKNRFGTTRSSLFRCYSNKIVINPNPQIFLNNREIDNVKNFCNKNEINNNYFNVLFECSPQSNQSIMNLEAALKLSNKIILNNKKIKFILSSNKSIIHNNNQIIDASSISIRENAELVNYCNLIIGCSSGISWISTCNWSKKIPMIQIISPNFNKGVIAASVKADFLFFGLNSRHVIELYNPDEQLIINCFFKIYEYNFNVSRKIFDQFNVNLIRNFLFIYESKINIIFKYVLLFCVKYNFAYPKFISTIFKKYL